MRGYYFITDEELSTLGIFDDVKKAVAADCCAIQYRDKKSDAATFIQNARALKTICGNTPFIINDRVDAACAVDADGVHVGPNDTPPEVARRLLGKKKIIGVSVSTVEEARSAADSGASYLGVGPVFETETKTDTLPAVGTQRIADIRAITSLPLVAIGGITLNNAREVIAAGADALCAISAVVTAPDVAAEIKKFQALFISR